MNNRKEIAVGGFLLILLVLLANPGDVLMPTMKQIAILTAVTVVFAVFATLVWRERGGDERDELHRLVADRAAFLTGAAALMVAILVQGTTSMIDPWLPLVLAALVVGKIAGLVYSKNKF